MDHRAHLNCPPPAPIHIQTVPLASGVLEDFSSVLTCCCFYEQSDGQSQLQLCWLLWMKGQPNRVQVYLYIYLSNTVSTAVQCYGLVIMMDKVSPVV